MRLTCIDEARLRYLLVGSWNTLFGYFIGIFLFYALTAHAHIVVIALISNMIAISMSYITYKLFVFKTSGNWLVEYFRCYLVYSMNAILGIFFLWVTVDIIKINIWISQGISISMTVFISYFLHKNFTFKNTET
jgi:putative flippase GtrA